MRTGRALLPLALLAAACGAAPEPAPSWQPAIEAWRPGQPVPDVPLVDQAGRPFKLGALADRWVLLSFVFTRCPLAEACPLAATRMAAAQTAWDEAGREPPLHLLLVSLDPEWDTPGRLAAWGEAQGLAGPQITLATGEPALVTDALPSLFNVLALPDGPDNLRHTVRAALLAPGLRPVAQWTDNAFAPDDVLAAASDP